MADTDMSMVGWVVSAVLTGGMGVLGFLLKYSFSSIQKSIADLSKEVKQQNDAHSLVKSDVRVLEEQAKHLQFRIELLEKRNG